MKITNGNVRTERIIDAASKISSAAKISNENYIVVVEEAGRVKDDGTYTDVNPNLKSFSDYCVYLSKKTGFHVSYFLSAARQWENLHDTLRTAEKTRQFLQEMVAESKWSLAAYLRKISIFRFKSDRILWLLKRAKSVVSFQYAVQRENYDFSNRGAATASRRMSDYFNAGGGSYQIVATIINPNDKKTARSVISAYGKKLGIKVPEVGKVDPIDLGKIFNAAFRDLIACHPSRFAKAA